VFAWLSVGEKVAQVRQIAGDRVDRMELSMVVTVIIAERRLAVAQQFAREKGWNGISSEQVLKMPSIFIGSADQIVEEMQARRERYRFSYFVLFDHAMGKAAPIVARLAGN
jgi:alkanesulfonate monooxygenase SsuD/methylene tetrahydromethanopterin reductase-like flavin-dependent oxidoreductase (luciferase family)